MSSRNTEPIQLSYWTTVGYKTPNLGQSSSIVYVNGVDSVWEITTYVQDGPLENQKKMRVTKLLETMKHWHLPLPFLQGILLGSLIAGIALAVVFTLYLTSSSGVISTTDQAGSTTTTTTATTITTTTTTTMTTTTTVTTTTTTTSSTSSTSSTSTSTALALTWNSTATTIAGTAAGVFGIANNQLNHPYGMALDSSNSLYIADYNNNRIQKWLSGATSGITVAGLANGIAGASSTALNMPVAIVLDSSNSMYFTDRLNHRVMYWANGFSSGTTIAGTTGIAGGGTNQFNLPSALMLNESANVLYIADTMNHRIVKWVIGASSGTIVAGGNGAGNGNTQLNQPYGCTFDSLTNSFIIANYGGHSLVRWILGATSWTLIAGVPGTAGSTSTMFNAPLSIVLDSMSNLFITDTNNHRIQFFYAGQSNGTTIAGITGSAGTANTQLNIPYWAIIDSQYNLYVADTHNNRVQKFYYG